LTIGFIVVVLTFPAGASIPSHRRSADGKPEERVGWLAQILQKCHGDDTGNASGSVRGRGSAPDNGCEMLQFKTGMAPPVDSCGIGMDPGAGVHPLGDSLYQVMCHRGIQIVCFCISMGCDFSLKEGTRHEILTARFFARKKRDISSKRTDSKS
jgi:hypothetical protein